jgi:protein-S-isoprenylcysteine O-methyltransferase Ste14
MNHNDPLQLLILAASWLLFGVTHSLLAGTTLERIFGNYSRLAFNCLAIVMAVLPFAISARMPEILLWNEPNWLHWIRHGISVATLLAFIHTLKFYSLPGFLGLKAETWTLTFSPWHRWVRHPWYFLTLILIWAHPMTETWLVTALCITLYLALGSRIEEKRILRYHPNSYAHYCRIVPSLIPWRGCALNEAARIKLESQALNESK